MLKGSQFRRLLMSPVSPGAQGTWEGYGRSLKVFSTKGMFVRMACTGKPKQKGIRGVVEMGTE